MQVQLYKNKIDFLDLVEYFSLGVSILLIGYFFLWRRIFPVKPIDCSNFDLKRDYDCNDLPNRMYAECLISRVGYDKFNFDRDNDGVACE